MRMQSIWKLTLGSLIFIFFSLPIISFSSSSGVILEESFETYPDDDFWYRGAYRPWQKIDTPQFVDSNITSVSIVEFPSRVGSRSLQFNLHYDDPIRSGNHRCEVDRPEINGDRTFFPLNQTWWFSFSIFIPEDWVIDDLYEVVMQLHQFTGSPPFNINIEQDEWLVMLTGDILSRVPLERGKWTDWIVQYRGAKDDSGLLVVWKDGVRLVDLANVQTAVDNDDGAVNLKYGVYKGRWINTPPAQTEQRTLFFDAVKIGDSSATYEEMSLMPEQSGEPIVIEADQDAVVRNKKPNDPQNSPTMYILPKSSDKRSIYMGFDISSIGVVNSANIKLYAMESSFNHQPGTAINVRLIDDDAWSEETITWNSSPPEGNVIGSQDGINPQEFAIVDITSALQNEADDYLSVRIDIDTSWKDPWDMRLTFASKESETISWRPVLIVE